MGELLDRWSDPLFGALTWRVADRVWVGQVQFGRHTVGVSLDPDRREPTADEQAAVIELARRLFADLSVVEPGLRRQAAVQIYEAVAEQDENAEVPLEAFAGSLEPEAITLHAGGGALHYRTPEFFPGQRVTIHFDDVLSFGDAELY